MNHIQILFELQSFDDLVKAILKKEKINFLLNRQHTNLNNKDVINEIEINEEIEFPPTLAFEKAELTKALNLCNLETEKGKWDYIVLLTYLNDGRIYYSNGNQKNNEYFFIKIDFQSMLTIEKIKEKFLDLIKEKSSNQFQIPHLPSLVLNMAINDSLNTTYNGESLTHAFGEHFLFCYIFQQWKSNYSIILNSYSPNGIANMTIGADNIKPKNIFDQKQKFEDLFSEIDSLQIFEPVNL